MDFAELFYTSGLIEVGVVSDGWTHVGYLMLIAVKLCHRI